MNSSNPIALETFNLTKKFDTLIAVDDTSFKVHEGSIVGILGPNGAGKTTTIRLITGIFELKGKSRVEIYSEDLTLNPKELKKKFGIVPEVSNAYSDYTVWQNLFFSGTIYGLSKEKIKERAGILLDRFELADKINSKLKTLSKGLKQRVNLCLALLHEPSILILDEPTSGLDPFSVSIVRNQILDLRKEGKTILITTHNMQEAQQICDRILIMNRGKIIADESPDELRKNFKSTSNIIFKIQGIVSNEIKEELYSLFKVIKKEKEKFNIISENPLEDIAKLNEFLKENDISIQDFSLKETSLEEVFIHLIEIDSFKNIPKNNRRR
ncbi:MAG: ATP-binding cassette domain-containing protein [Promethearchaeota archaeon]